MERPAIVLGSTQGLGARERGGSRESPVPGAGIVDVTTAEADGVDLARRRSGGGAVWLEPGGQVWLDIVIPVDDPLWVDDVRQSPGWLGEAWRDALGEGSVWDGPVVGEWARDICFAGIGPGEVHLGGEPMVKLVGISQRRTKDLARFQCVAYLDWQPQRLAGYFLDHRLRAFLPSGRAVAGEHWDIVQRLLSHLPQA